MAGEPTFTKRELRDVVSVKCNAFELLSERAGNRWIVTVKGQVEIVFHARPTFDLFRVGEAPRS